MCTTTRPSFLAGHSLPVLVVNCPQHTERLSVGSSGSGYDGGRQAWRQAGGWGGRWSRHMWRGCMGLLVYSQCRHLLAVKHCLDLDNGDAFLAQLEHPLDELAALPTATVL